MKFFHAYNDFFNPGLEKNGFINKDSGFKLVNVFATPTEKRFNEYAFQGSPFYNFIKEGNFPFYVDRVAGGITFLNYPYDKKTIDAYKELLGDWFLGFQMHESASNLRNGDWPRMISKMGSKGPYDLAEFREKMRSTYAVAPDGRTQYEINHDTPEYYASRTYSEHFSDYFDDVRDMFRRRIEATYNNVLAADSSFLMSKVQSDMGIRNFMPEIGGCCRLTRMAVALARGTARAGKGRKWGTYYEAWWQMPDGQYCMPSYTTNFTNEWYLSQETHPDNFTAYGPNGGSSRNLQKRMYFYTLISGADYIAEEWGMRSSFSDFHDFTLSPYGEVKKEFVDKALSYQGMQAHTPFAIVMPADHLCIQYAEGFEPDEYKVHRDLYMRTVLTPEEKARIGHTEDVLKLAFLQTGERYGNEGLSMTNSRFGDLFDIIYADESDEVFSRYDYLIDASHNSSFAKAKAGSGFKILESRDLDALEDKIHSLEKEVMPCVVDGLHWLVSTDEKGQRYLTIFNNEGNERDTFNGDILHREAEKTVNVWFKDKTEPTVTEEFGIGLDIQKKDDHNYMINIPAAGFVILKF